MNTVKYILPADVGLGDHFSYTVCLKSVKI